MWSKAVKDTAGLEAYHAAHVGDFMWDTRAEVDIFTCADEKAVKAARKAVKKGKDLVAFQRDYNAENGNSITLTSGRFSEGDNTWGDKYWPMLPQEPCPKKRPRSPHTRAAEMKPCWST